MSDEAIQRYEKELAEDPQSRAFAPLAEAYRKAGRLDDAINTARAGLEVHSGYSSGLVVLGRALYEKGELDNAAETLQAAVKENPESYLGQKFLGKVLMDKGEIKGALEALESANFLSPEDEDVARLLDKVKSKAAKPETMHYEAEESDTAPKAQIVTYEQKPTTIDGIELPPIPQESDSDDFSFSGGGTVDPADITPVPVHDAPEDSEAAAAADIEADAENMTAAVIEEDDVEQTVEIGSIDELGPEAAAFIQEGEEFVVESVDDTADEDTSANADVVGEFVIEVEEMSPTEPESEISPEPVAASPASGDTAPEPELAPEPESAPEPVSETEPAQKPAPVPEPEFELPSEPAAAPAASGDTAPEPELAPEPPPVPSLTEDFDGQLEPVAPIGSEPESAPVPGPAFDVDFEPGIKPEPGPLFIPEPEPETDIAPEASPVPVQEAAPVSGPVLSSESASELPSAPEPTSDGQFSTETLADLYAQQGLIEKAVSMYQQILEQDPGNEGVKLKLDNLEPQAQSDPATKKEIQTTAEGKVESPRVDEDKDTLSVLERLLENVERIKRP